MGHRRRIDRPVRVPAGLVVPRRYGAPPPGAALPPRHGSRAPRAPGAEPDRRPAGGPDHGPAPPVPFTAPAAPGARPAPAGAEIDRVLDELAHRLEQAVEDLGLDGEG